MTKCFKDNKAFSLFKNFCHCFKLPDKDFDLDEVFTIDTIDPPLISVMIHRAYVFVVSAPSLRTYTYRISVHLI